MIRLWLTSYFARRAEFQMLVKSHINMPYGFWSLQHQELSTGVYTILQYILSCPPSDGITTDPHFRVYWGCCSPSQPSCWVSPWSHQSIVESQWVRQSQIRVELPRKTCRISRVPELDLRPVLTTHTTLSPLIVTVKVQLQFNKCQQHIFQLLTCGFILTWCLYTVKFQCFIPTHCHLLVRYVLLVILN